MNPGDTGERGYRMPLWPERHEWVPILAKAITLVVVGMVGVNSGVNSQVDDIAAAELRIQEEASSPKDITHEAELEAEYGLMHEMIRHEAVEDATCDGALEMYARHFGDEEEWRIAYVACHSMDVEYPE